ncbi:MAG: DUF4399 domain-containing protein [Gemmatimonadota bacterium]|nr:DUF4399 domain-containing protein [Gemmatimonadota bacterium]
MRPTAVVTGPMAVLIVLSNVGCARGDRMERGDAAIPTAEIVQPADGTSVSGPNVTVELAVEHVNLAPAGTNEPNTGHLHLFINRDLTPEGEVIPVGEGIVHLGQAQREYLMEGLAPGEYVVIAVLGDWAHVRIPGAITDTARIVVQ